MLSLKNKIIKGGVITGLIFSGYLLGRFFDIPYFEFSKSIDITNIFSLLLTAFLAIMITTVFEKKNNDNRVEKDLIINRVGNIFEIASSLQIESNTGKIHHTEASSSIKRINTSVNSVYKIVDKCHFKISDEIKDKIKANISDLRDTLTNTPVLSEDTITETNLPIEIRESIIYYNRDRIAQIEVKFDGLKDLLLELQVEINKK